MLECLSRLWPNTCGPFMRHDRWDSALFLHWKFQKTLIEALLPPGLYVDTIPNNANEPEDALAWLGMVLLSELGVGASCCRAVTVNHHGANLRVYVIGPDGPGIFFLSLECSSIVASIGARGMAIPYWPSSMTRAEVTFEKTNQFQMTGKRYTCCSSKAATPHVDCIWTTEPPVAASHSHKEKKKDNTQWVKRASFFLERYRVYTFRGGQLYSGTVSHQSWPVIPAQLQQLNQSLSAVIEGLPIALGAPTHCCYSKGVGPVEFEMLRPCLN